MKFIIAGGRNYLFTYRDYDILDWLLLEHRISEVVCGGATGADDYGRRWGNFRQVPVRIFRADWKKHGKKAGPLRNDKMAKYANGCIVFPGGKGSKNMVEQAQKNDLILYNLMDKKDLENMYDKIPGPTDLQDIMADRWLPI